MSRDDKEAFELTELGEAVAVDTIGGQDIINVAAAARLVLEKEWSPETGWTFGESLAAWTVAKSIRACLPSDTWGTVVEQAEQLLEEERPEFFETMPHAWSAP